MLTARRLKAFESQSGDLGIAEVRFQRLESAVWRAGGGDQRHRLGPFQRGAWILEDDYDSEFRYHGRPLPPLLQASVADFIRQGHFYRHLKRMRPLYRQRREWLTQALERRLGAWQQGLAVQALSD